MDDISIELLKGIKKSFSSGVEDSKTINDLLKKLDDKKADYEDAQKYAIEVGELLSRSFEENIDSAALPNGKMYYNIAKKVVDPELKEGFEKVSDYSTKVQKILNEDAKIGLKVQSPTFNQARSNGIVRRLADAESYDDVSWILKDPVVNFHQSVVDDTIKVNAETHYKAGMHPKITRKVAGKACDWCMNLAGTYEYPDDVRDEVYHRHRDCRCIVTYDPGNGKTVQDVHTKKWQDVHALEIENRKTELEKIYVGKDVTPEYYGAIRTDKKELLFDENLVEKDHKVEIEVANLVVNKFGGEMKVLQENNQTKMPDYLWNDKFWDLKTCSSEKACNSAIRHGLKQIANNPGGIILDYRSFDADLNKIRDNMDSRMKYSNFSVDIMVIQTGERFKVFRYKK